MLRHIVWGAHQCVGGQPPLSHPWAAPPLLPSLPSTDVHTNVVLALGCSWQLLTSADASCFASSIWCRQYGNTATLSDSRSCYGWAVCHNKHLPHPLLYTLHGSQRTFAQGSGSKHASLQSFISRRQRRIQINSCLPFDLVCQSLYADVHFTQALV